MPRVLHVAQPVDGGVGGYVADVAADQAARGWEVVVAGPADGLLPERVRALGLPHRSWEASRSPGPGVPGEVRALGRVVAAVAPDVVHLHSSKAGLCGRLLLRGRLPTLFAPHGWSWLAATGPVAAASLRWERLGARWADRLVCVGEGEEQDACRSGVQGRTAVVRNGVDVAHWAAAAADRSGARRALGVGDDAPLAVCVGRPSRQKGHDRLLDAWPRVRAAVPGARAVVVGDGPDRGALQARAAEGVELPGEGRVAEHLAAADVVVLPSRWEGLSLALLEALAAGRAVVTTAVSGSEVVAAGTGEVLTADPLDDAAVTAGLVAALVPRLTDRPGAHAEGRRAGAYAEAELDVVRTRDRLAALTEQVLAERSPR